MRRRRRNVSHCLMTNDMKLILYGLTSTIALILFSLWHRIPCGISRTLKDNMKQHLQSINSISFLISLSLTNFIDCILLLHSYIFISETVMQRKTNTHSKILDTTSHLHKLRFYNGTKMQTLN